MLVADEDGAAARMRFAGRHIGVFMGFAPTGRVLAWSGAAFFRFRDGRIAALWVLGDLAALREQLGAPEAAGDG
jgi:predicted ester cyclase